jgi:hypothetical protein
LCPFTENTDCCCCCCGCCGGGWCWSRAIGVLSTPIAAGSGDGEFESQLSCNNRKVQNYHLSSGMMTTQNIQCLTIRLENIWISPENHCFPIKFCEWGSSYIQVKIYFCNSVLFIILSTFNPASCIQSIKIIKVSWNLSTW